jgi:hypothetical protein
VPQLRLPANRVVASFSVLAFLGVASTVSSALRFLEGASALGLASSESDSSESSESASESSLSSESSSESSESSS